MSEQELARTALWSRHQAAGGRMVPFAGYELPVRYTSQVDEHHAVRRAAGLFDVSHMGEFSVRGAGAEAFLQWATPNDVAKLKTGRAHYTSLLGPDGRFLDDLLIYRRGEQDFLLVVNAATRSGDYEHLLALRSSWQGESLDLEDESDQWALLALQGPRAAKILARVLPLVGADIDLEVMVYYGFAETEIGGEPAIVSRTGYTGEDGFELYVAPEQAVGLWDLLIERGAEHGLLPAGLGARDTLRLEAGMHLSGQDLGPETNPLEVGLGWTVKLGKGDFVGREALLRAKEAGLSRRLVGFRLHGRGIARLDDRLVPDAADAGFHEGVVTSGTWSPTLEQAIGLALVSGDAGFAKPQAGTRIRAVVRGREIEGELVDLPFYRR